MNSPGWNVQDENSFVFYHQKKPSKTLWSLFSIEAGLGKLAFDGTIGDS
jgi:hypothetical protein